MKTKLKCLINERKFNFDSFGVPNLFNINFHKAPVYDSQKFYAKEVLFIIFVFHIFLCCFIDHNMNNN